MHKFLLITAIALLPTMAHAQVMKCMGAGGRIEFAAVCPPGTKAENTGIRNAPGATSAAPGKSLTERDAEFRKRRMESDQAEKKSESKAVDDADRKQNCASAQAYLTNLQAGGRVGKTNPQTGERVFLEEENRAAEIVRAKKAVATNCK